MEYVQSMEDIVTPLSSDRPDRHVSEHGILIKSFGPQMYMTNREAVAGDKRGRETSFPEVLVRVVRG